jgi:hypothetical protein
MFFPSSIVEILVYRLMIYRKLSFAVIRLLYMVFFSISRDKYYHSHGWSQELGVADVSITELARQLYWYFYQVLEEFQFLFLLLFVLLHNI